jgi:hypothetical protein
MHWEWRGFGTPSSGFLERYEALPLARDWQGVQDTYFCLPSADVNLKLRDGAEDGLKLKRRLRRSGEFELWTERLEDILLFPATAEEVGALAREAGLWLPEAPQDPLDRDTVVALLSRARPRPDVVVVRKSRETHRLWEGEAGVLVELAEVRAPCAIHAVGIQNAADLEDADDTEIEAAEALVRRAFQALGLASEGLEAHSYVSIARTWIR